MLAVILVFGLFGPPKPVPCPSRDLVQCVDTRALNANPGFPLALHDFLGVAHERLLHGDRPLYDQVLELMARPDGQAAPKVGEDMRLFAGCRKMACPACRIVKRRWKSFCCFGTLGVMKRFDFE